MAAKLPTGTPRQLAELIRSHLDEILRRWQAGVRRLPHADVLDEPRLVDHIPDLLERIAQMIDELAIGHTPELGQASSERHALARLEEGFDIQEVVGEFEVLRDVVLETLDHPDIGPLRVDELRVVNRAIDRAVSDSVARYSEVRERTLLGFDRIAAAALEATSLDELLRRLLRVLHETTPAIDTSSIYLLEGDVLRARASVGMGREDEEGLTIRVGEGFAGKVALTGKPLTVHHPSAEDLSSPILARANLRVLCGMPIVDGSRIIGVAKIGSLHADEFSSQDQRIFTAMVARASAAILHHLLREQAERTAEQLADRERQLRALADNIPQLAWMADASGHVYWYNQRWYAYTGTTLDEAKGWGWQKVQHPEHVDRVVDKIRVHFASGEPWEDVFPLRGKDGHYRWFLSRMVPIRDAAGNIERWFGTNTDITARRFLYDAARILGASLDYRGTLEQLARLVVPDLADWCIVDLVEDGRARHVAIAHSDETKLELAREYARAHPPDLERDVGTREVLRTGEAWLVSSIDDETLTRTTRDPEHLRLLRQLGFRSWIGAPLTARGHTLGVLHLVMSDSPRRYSQADVEIATELGERAGAAVDNARLYRNAQDAVRVRDDVLAIVSHDLRNPLAAVDLAATLLLQQLGSDPRGRKHLEAIRRSMDRMTHLIDDLLDMASINAGRFSISPTDVPANDLVEEVLDMQLPLASERGIKIVRECEVQGIQLRVDRNRIVQAFANLLGNALKFCNPGDVVFFRAQRERERVRFEVTDSGPGIPAAELPHIFEPYWSGRTRKKGTGLGLFITKAIIEAHGGEIAVASKVGKGSTFTIRLPIRTPNQE